MSCFIACTLLPALRSRIHKIPTQLSFLHAEVGFYNIPAHWPGSDTLSEAHHPTKLYINPPSLPLQALFSRLSLLPLLVSVWPAGMIAQISPSYLNCHWWAEELTSLASTHSAQHFPFLLFQRWAGFISDCHVLSTWLHVLTIVKFASYNQAVHTFQTQW